MKKTILYIAAGLLGAASFAACDDDFARPPMVLPPTVDVDATTTIEQIKDEYWPTMSTATTIGVNPETGDSIIFKGRVCSSDETGNIYKKIYVQSKDENGEQITIPFYVNASDMYEQYPFGQEVVVWATGLTIGSSYNVLTFGDPSDKDFYMTEELFYAHIARTGLGVPEPSKVDTTATTIAELLEVKNDSEKLKVWQSRLIRVENCSWVEAGQPYSNEQYGTNRYLVDENGNRLMVRNSTFTNYSTDLLPYGTGSVVGILSMYSGQFQLTMIDQEGCIGFDGETPPPGEVVEPAGEGTLESPYNVAKALEVTKALKDGEQIDNVYVEGVISSITELSTSFGNATYSIVDKGSYDTFGVYRGMSFGGAKFTSEDQLEVGATVVVKGSLVNYKGNTPQLAQGNELVSYNGQTGGSTTPGESGTPSGDGTEASPYNAAKALEVAKALDENSQVENVYVTGTVAAISELSTSFGNATYTISDGDGSATFSIYRGYGLNGEKFTSEDQLKVGAKVVVKGTILNFKGNTPQMTAGSQIVSYDGETSDGGATTPSTGSLYSFLSESLTAMPSDWTIENVTLGTAEYVWQWKVYQGKGYLNGSAFVNNTAIATEAYAISPVIDLSGATGCSLSFDHAAKFQTTLKQLCGVVAREEGSSEWKSLTIPTWPGTEAWTFVNSGNVDLSVFDGKRIQVAFKYGSSAEGADTWEIKNLAINGKK